MVPKNFFVEWFAQHGRRFPWRRKDTSHFALLVTEMLLRQTRAAAVMKVWDKLIQKYPNAEALAAANIYELKSLISVLGFGRMRSEALVTAAKWLVAQHAGSVPEDIDLLLRVPHVGRYATHAVLCFGFGHRIEIVDGNVLRFFKRYHGLEVNPDIRRNPEVVQIARETLPRAKAKAALHNYGLLDFTADICRPVNPRCEICSLSKSCHFGRLRTTPAKKNCKSTPVKKHYSAKSKAP